MHTAAAQVDVLGPQHWVVLAVFLAGCVALVLLGSRVRRRPWSWTRASRLAGAAILVGCAPFELIDVVVGAQHPRTGLPLQLCDIGWLVAGLALVTGDRRLCGLAYYWGLTLCVQGVVTPELDHGFPDVQFFGFWLRHLAPVWAAVFLVGARVGPGWREYRFAVVVTACWAALMMSVNSVMGSNYGYLNGKPSGASALDPLGPWPWYVLVEVVLVIGVWALITWPWNRSRSA